MLGSAPGPSEEEAEAAAAEPGPQGPRAVRPRLSGPVSPLALYTDSCTTSGLQRPQASLVILVQF